MGYYDDGIMKRVECEIESYGMNGMEQEQVIEREKEKS